MHMSNQTVLVILFVGLVAGWLAGQIVRGAGFGLIGDLVIGIIGAFIGDWLLPQVGIHLHTGFVSAIVQTPPMSRRVLFSVKRGFCEAALEAAGAEAGADADGGSGEGKRIPACTISGGA